MAFFIAGVVSYIEKEARAGNLFLGFSFLFFLLYFLLYFLDNQFFRTISYAISSTVPIIMLTIFTPISKLKGIKREKPTSRFDERDTPLSRRRLKPGSKNFNDYYSNKPENKKHDDLLHTKPGLLNEKSSRYHLSSFKAADSNFQSIELIKPYVDGKINKIRIKFAPHKISVFLRNWLKKQGVHDVGFCKLKNYHKYSVSGKLSDFGKEIEIDHKYAIAFVIEMDKEMIDCAPNGPAIMESSQAYLNSGIMAVNLANYIRSLGYPARAHIDGNYEIICPLVARDAGLGEIGRMGILITPKLGPRVRIAVIT
ncbi:MAG: reductive dehalogenase domain-containing protein, partial [Bacteroidota bacterium]|nr:reductive dehalogenase domain-containing protein [Bacteroidota bacterium]